MSTFAIRAALLRAASALAIAFASLAAPPASAQMQPVAGNPEPGARPVRRVPLARPTAAAPPVMSAVPNAGAIVRVSAGMRTAQVLALHDDQVVETPSGHRMRVGEYRRLQAMFAGARARSMQQHAAPFAILPAPSERGTPRRPGESAAQLLARPPTDVIRLASGRSVSVAQLRAIAPYVQHRYHVDLMAAAPGRPLLTGPATRVESLSQLKSVPRNAPDATILESPQGTRVTLGEIRAVLRAQRPQRRRIQSQGGSQP